MSAAEEEIVYNRGIAKYRRAEFRGHYFPNPVPTVTEKKERSKVIFAERQRRVRLLAQIYWQTGLIDIGAANKREDDGYLICSACEGVIDLSAGSLSQTLLVENKEGKWTCAGCVKRRKHGQSTMASREEARPGVIGCSSCVQGIAMEDSPSCLPGEDRRTA